MSHWLSALGGGLLIGAAVLLLYATVGLRAGISNIAFGGLWARAGDRGWRWLFLACLVAGGAAAVAAGAAPLTVTSVPVALPLVSGLLVGFGTRLGNGCTSGHGICGLASVSPRSLAAVLTFMGVGMLTATLLRPLLP